MMRLALAAGLMLVLAGPALAKAERCMAKIVRNVEAEEQPDSVLPAGGGLFGPVTVVRIDRKTTRAVLCAHGSYCYSASAFDFVTPCRFEPSTYSDEISIELAPK